ncbi:hypothetical protein BDR07DRAFT_1345479, partial [Suillus spraguei]
HSRASNTCKFHSDSAFAITIHLIVPDAANVEHYFLGLGGVQSVKRCNLSVQTFKSLSKLHQFLAQSV